MIFDASGLPAFERTVTVRNERGLHARAAARFVQVAGGYNARIEVLKDGHRVSGNSIMGLMMLAAARGSQFVISASGPEAEAALAALCGLVEGGFGEI